MYCKYCPVSFHATRSSFHFVWCKRSELHLVHLCFSHRKPRQKTKTDNKQHLLHTAVNPDRTDALFLVVLCCSLLWWEQSTSSLISRLISRLISLSNLDDNVHDLSLVLATSEYLDFRMHPHCLSSCFPWDKLLNMLKPLSSCSGRVWTQDTTLP